MAGRRKKCMVPGCQTDIADHPYMRKRGVCAVHMHAHSVQLYGMAHRFCQQCGRFQPLTDFVKDYRSCEMSMLMHNQRRRERYLRNKSAKARQQGAASVLPPLPEPPTSDEDCDNSDAGSDDDDVPPAAAAGGAAPQAPAAPPAAAAVVEPQHPVPAGAAYNGMAAPLVAGAQPAAVAVANQAQIPAGPGAAYNNGLAAEVNMHAGLANAGAMPAYNPPGAQVPAAVQHYYAVQQPAVWQPQLVQPQHLLSRQQQQYQLPPAVAMPAPAAYPAFEAAAGAAVMEPPAVMYGGVAHNIAAAAGYLGQQDWQLPYAPAGTFMPPAQQFVVQQLQPGPVGTVYGAQGGFGTGSMQQGGLLAGHPGPQHSMGGGMSSFQANRGAFAVHQGGMQQAPFYGQAAALPAVAAAGTAAATGRGSGLRGFYFEGAAHNQLGHLAGAPPQRAWLTGGLGRANMGSAAAMSGAVAGAGAEQPFGPQRRTARLRQRRRPGPASTVPDAPGFWQLTGEAQHEVGVMGTVIEGGVSRGAGALASPLVGLSAGAQASSRRLHAESAAAAVPAGARAGVCARPAPGSYFAGADAAGAPSAVSCFAAAAQQVPMRGDRSGAQGVPGTLECSRADSAALAFLESIEVDPAMLHVDGVSQTGAGPAGSSLSQELGSLLDDAMLFDAYDSSAVSRAAEDGPGSLSDM